MTEPNRWVVKTIYLQVDPKILFVLFMCVVFYSYKKFSTKSETRKENSK